MAHFALICPPFLSHVRAFEALGEALAARGHRTTFVMNAGAGALVRPGTWRLHEIGMDDRPESVGVRSTGLFGILRTVGEGARRTSALAAGAPMVLREIGADAVLGDQMEPAAGLVAAHLGLPLVSIASALPIDPDPGLPPPYLDWSYDPTPEGLKRNRGGERVARLLLRRHGEAIRRAALSLGLEPKVRLEDWLSPLATLSQTVPGFDFPRPASSRLLGVGPLRSSGEGEGVLPFARDPSRPLVFASLGTLQGHRLPLFRTIARAARALGCQLVVAHCGRLSPAAARSIDADFVTDFLPQRAMMDAADVCITHAGLNTVLDAMRSGVPTLAIPIAYDQPGVAARLVHHGAGLRLPRRRLGADAVEAALARLLGEPGFRSNALRIGDEIERAGGAERAAREIEALVPAHACLRSPVAA